MKIVILLAGQGKRFGRLTLKNHKYLIKIYKSIDVLKNLSGCLEEIFFDEIIFVLGHCGKKVKSKIKYYFIKNKKKHRFLFIDDFKNNNNLYSLFAAKKFLNDNDFIVINGDTIFPDTFLKKIISQKKTSISFQESSNLNIDAPKIYLDKKNLLNIKHYHALKKVHNNKFIGYLTGIIMIKKEFASTYFKNAEKLLNINPEKVGYYHPLVGESIKDVKLINQVGLWTDFDEIKEIDKVKLILKTNMELKKIKYLF